MHLSKKRMMQDRCLYEYAIIRLVPLVEREEFINIGAILLCSKTGFLNLKYQLDASLIRALNKDIDISLIKSYLDAWKLVCEGKEEGGKIGSLDLKVRFRWLTANRSTIIQSSAVHPGFTKDPESQLDTLFEKFVLKDK